MNIGIFSTHYLWPTHFETDLELLQLNIDLKNNVFFYNCNRCITNCELIWHWATEQNVSINQMRDSTCFKCMEKQKTGFSLIEGQFVQQSIINDNQKHKKYILDVKDIVNAATLKKLVIDNSYEIGWSLMSSLISMYRDPFINPLDHRQELSDLFQDSCRIYYSTKQYIKENNLEHVYLFNGRLSYTKAILSAAKALNTDAYISERGSEYKKYSLFKNHTIHNIDKITQRINESWNLEKNENIKYQRGSQFFKDRENNIIGSWYSFLDNQNIGQLPSNWNNKNQNITFYTSSEDEFVSISREWDLTLFKTQLKGIKFVSDIVANLTNTHLYIRVHPNVKNMSDNYKLLLTELSENKNTTLISYESAISSYALLKNSNKIITFGSTVGIEAVYWGKPSILLGKSLYCNLKGVIIPQNLDELTNLITKENIKIPASNDALKFGYFMKTFGIEYQYYEPVDFMSGYFKGINLEEQKKQYKPSFIKKNVSRARKLLNYFNIYLSRK